MDLDWSELLLAYLHDPPDKALSIAGHVRRGRDNAQVALEGAGVEVSRRLLEESVAGADPIAAMVERLPMPRAGEAGQWAVGPEQGQLETRHPLSGQERTLAVPALDDALGLRERECLRRLIEGLEGGASGLRRRFLAIWRLWPERLAEEVDPVLACLPADTRVPDHTIWHHLDATAAFKATECLGQGAAILAFALGPVQPFIEAARSLRDLWSGSMILSWLAFQAMLPVIGQLGPSAVVYPALRGNPWVDLWLEATAGLAGKVPAPAVPLRLTPALPHRFLAVVPWGTDGQQARQWADRCRQAAHEAWKTLADKVRQEISPRLSGAWPKWDKRWDAQIENYFWFRTAAIPLGGPEEEIDRRLADLLAGRKSFQDAFPDAEAVRQLARCIPPPDQPAYAQEHAGRWQYQVELVHRALAAHRAIRHVPANPAFASGERFPQKCSLLGTFEQMGPEELGQSAKFWDSMAKPNGLSLGGVRVRAGEALCAVALAKRFAAPAFFQSALQVSAQDLKFPDTWTVAAAEWLHQAGIDWKSASNPPWNGHWLHWRRPDEDLDEAVACPQALWDPIQRARDDFGPAPVYYAILKLDGDELGAWLRGEKSPAVRQIMHPKLVEYYEKTAGDAAQRGLDARRPVSPSLHAAISSALANFALHVVPQVAEEYHGTVIYSGGDDTLVVLPVGTALQCALELQKAYTSDWYQTQNGECPMMGRRATLSGGLAIVHAKDDLRLALRAAREAEDLAKDSGRNCLAVAVCRRSGAHTAAICPWTFLAEVDHWRKAFALGASDRWAYRLYQDREVLGALPVEAIRAEVRRQLDRAEVNTRRRFGEPPHPKPGETAGECLAAQFDQFRQSVTDGRYNFSIAKSLDQFLTLCQAASFMARGREE